MSAVNSAFGTSWSPTSAMASGGTSSAVRASSSSPPHPVAAKASAHTESRATSLRKGMRIGVQGGLSGQPKLQDSIDQLDRRLEAVRPPRDLPALARVHGGIRKAAQLAELARA